MAKDSAAARKMRRDLEAQRAAVSATVGRQQSWDACELQLIDQLCGHLNRQTMLQAELDLAPDTKARVKVSTELRLTGQAIAALVKQLKPKVPASKPSTPRARQAQRAANMRWGNQSA
jgi:hypothetical protein